MRVASSESRADLPAAPAPAHYHLLDPDRARRLREIGVANDLTRKVELLAGDGVGIMRRFDQRFDGRQERPVLRRNVAAKGGDRAAYVDAVRIIGSTVNPIFAVQAERALLIYRRLRR